MGAPFMDYILVNDFVVPAGQQPFFTGTGPPALVLSGQRRPAESPNTPSRGGVRTCRRRAWSSAPFNNSYKITPEMFDVWMELLKAIPGSVLWLLEGNRFVPANLPGRRRPGG